MIEQFWAEFVAATGIDGPYDAWAFGEEGTAQATELAALVRDGPKRATTGLVAEYEAEGEPLPLAGELSVILDGDGVPVCVIRNTQVDVSRFGDVDESFASDEGEDDRTLESWRRIHLEFFRSVGWPVDDGSKVVLCRFELLWPVAAQPPAPPM